MPKVRVNNIELYYEVHGQGYPVVFLHGFKDAVEMWKPQLSVFSQDYRLIIYDARGHGQSESPSSVEQYSADIVVEDLFQLLGVLGVEKAVVGGLSMGGYISLRFYLRHPEKVSALIIMDTGPGYRNPERMAEWTKDREEYANFIERYGLEAFAERYYPLDKDMVHRHTSVTGLANMSRKVVAQHDSLVIENLSKIKVPFLVLVGEDDVRFLRASEYMSKTIPGAKHAVIPKAGHVSNLDNAEAFNKVVLDFLSKLNLPKI
ncbi:alpha/beta fold hydrolase [Chloroflexota bacterium]